MRCGTLFIYFFINLFFIDVQIKGKLKCEHCKFETDCQNTLKLHNRHHVENPNAAFKCCFCPFYANDKQ